MITQLIIEINRMLNIIKGFSSGYSFTNYNKMMIDYKGKRYMATFEEVCNAEDEEMLETMKRCFRE